MPLRILSSVQTSGILIAPESTTSNAAIRVPHGVAPSSPTNGDIWTTSTGLHVRISGATINLGSGTVTSVGLSLPAMFTVSNSPVTTSGTLTATLASQTANTFLAAPSGSNGVPSFRTIVSADIPITYTASLRANVNISGGGTITVNATGSVLWSQRFIIISNGNGSNFGTSGFFEITCPTTGTITGVGGAANTTATAAGIPLGNYEAIYYILPIGAASASVPANFRVVSYTSAIDIPHDWVLVCLRNGDNGTFYFTAGYTLPLSGSIITSSYNARRANFADQLTTARNIGGVSFNGSADINLPGVNTAGTQNTTGSAATLTTARTLTIGSTGKTFNGSANVAWTTTEIGAEFQAPAGIPRSNLGQPTVREMALFDAEFDNKTDRFNISNVWVETSTDNITWTDASPTDQNKRRLVGGDQTDSSLVIPYGTPYFRIRLRAVNYVYLNALYMYWSSQGHNSKVQIFKKHDSGSWVAHTNSTVTVDSWPGHLFLPFATEIPWHPAGTLGTHYNEVYVLFIPTWNVAYPSNNIALFRMQWWGGYPAGRRNLYTTTEFGAALFPNTVSATTLTSTVTTGTAPLTITSTTEVANLNAALLNGVASATTNTNNTIVRRDASGNFSAGTITATNYADTIGAYNVNLGSGGSEGRGLVAGYSGGSYSGIGYNVKHTVTGATYIAPNADTSSYLLFNASGFTFYGAASGLAGRTLSYKSLATLNFSGQFSPVGTIIAPAAENTLASIRLPHGTAPTSPTNGDMWTTTAGLYVRINGGTVGPLGSGGGGGGTVTSIATGTGLTGGTITTSGTISIDQGAQIVSTRANSTTTGDGQIYLNGATGNRIEFGTNGVAAPAFTTRSVGTKVLLYPAISASNVDYALGIDSQRFWLSVPGNVSSDVFSFYGGTTEVLRLTGDGRLRTLAGTALLPAISPGLNGSDLDTGIFFPAADTIAFSEGGVEVMRIDSSARVGIGTSSPVYTLDVIGTFRTNNIAYVGEDFTFTSSQRRFLLDASADGVVTYTNNTATVGQSTGFLSGELYLDGSQPFLNHRSINTIITCRNTSTSNVLRGFYASGRTGNSGAASKVTGFTGGVNIEGSGNVTDAIALEVEIFSQTGNKTITNLYGLKLQPLTNSVGTITNTYGVYIDSLTAGTQTNAAFGLYQAGSDKNYFAGNVGIGTTTPVGTLHLYKAAAATRLAIDGDAGQNRLISYRTGALQRFGLYVNNTAESGSNAGSNFAIRAYSDAGTLLSTPFFINRATGNVGIGTLSPTERLDVVGAIRTSSAANTVTASGATMSYEGAVGAYFMSVGANATTRGTFIFNQRESDAGGSNNFLQVDNQCHIFLAQSNGNVGIGVSTASSPSARLQVKGSGATSGTTALRVENSSGTGALEIMDDGQLRVGAGTASLPSISAGLNSSDTNTGIYFPGGDQMALATNGVGRLFVSNTGVGIGTNPAMSFDCQVSGGILIKTSNDSLGINVSQALAYTHIGSDPARQTPLYLRIDAEQVSNDPGLKGTMDYTDIYDNVNGNYILGTPDYWMEIRLGHAIVNGKGGGIVLIPCYLPAP